MSSFDDMIDEYEVAASVSQTDFSQLGIDDFANVEYDSDGAPYGMVMGVPVAINQPAPAPQIEAPVVDQPENEPSLIEAMAERGREQATASLNIGAGVLDGINTAAMELLETTRLSKVADWLDSKIPLSIDYEKPTSVEGTLGSGVGQVGAGMIPAARMTKALGAVSKFLRWTVAGALTDFAFFDPDDSGLGDLARDLGEVDNETLEQMRLLIADSFAKNEDDGELEKRLKTVGEGVVAGATIDSLILLYRGARGLKNGGADRLTQVLIDAGVDVGEGLQKAVRGVDQALDRGVEMMGGGDTLGMGVGPVPKKATLTKILQQFKRAENDALRAAARDTKQFTAFKRRAAEVKATYQTDDGWLPIEATGAKIGKKGEIKVSWRQPAYEFNQPPRGVSPEEHLQRMTEKTVSDVGAVVERARAGDAKAQEIIDQARWYRDMRSRLRAEFGGLGDTFADLLGATSAQTVVEQNWKNSIEILRRFTRGEYDDQIKMYMDRIEAGEPISPTLLQQLDKAGEFDLIKSAAGKLFNTNSPAATGALLDMFRQVKAGSAPKTINFTGNLIGYSSDATIDVWAARYLREAAGLPRIPPPAEKAVGGKHLTGSTLDDPRISGEFKFGQEVFAGAADEINRSNIIKNYDTDLGDLGPDDLQALVWFLEKEKWAKNNWTTKAGEGGSLDFEAGLAGAADPAAVLEARRTATATFEPPKKRKRETDEEYAVRVDEARTAFDERRIAAEQSIEEMAAPLERTVLGVARERPDNVPTNVQQAELASELTTGIADDTSVVAFQTNNTYGEFMGELERSLNAEFVTRSNFDSGRLTRNLVEAGKKYDQDAVFISKVLREPTEQSRPGVEIYFTRREGVDMAQRITAMLREKGVDGFTFITDARQMDRVDVQAASNEATAGLTGIRFQYIPEFDDGYDAARNVEIMDEKQDLFEQIIDDVLDLPGVAQADVVHYDTQVFRRATDTDRMTGGETYDAYLGTASGKSNRSKRAGQPSSSGTASADSGTQ